ncbi:MAG: helix-turn-helix transcriptional regulator [Myxococcota bacterium]
MPSPPAFRHALAGDIRSLGPWLSELDASADPVAHGWAAAARALRWFAAPQLGAPPTVDTVQAFSGAAGVEEPAAEALALIARASFLDLDRPRLDRCHALLRHFTGREAILWAEVSAGYIDALSGRGDDALLRGQSVFRGATESALPTLVAEATTLQGLGHMARGDIGDATTVIRRALRMAQTEHLWLSHYLASVILGRLRRLGGRPHLAGLIAKACLEATSSAFSGWLRWEQFFSGTELIGTTDSGTLNDAANALGTWQRDAPRAPVPDVVGVHGSVFHHQDLEALRAASRVSEASFAWLRGIEDVPPPALWGLSSPAWATGSAASPVAVAAPGQPGQRMLGFAAPDHYQHIGPFGTRPARPEAIASALTLAGPEGIVRSELFERSYGFKFRKSVHEPSFKVARHEAKRLLEGYAELHAEGERVALRPLRPYAVPDPRCQKPLQEVMLRWLAVPGGATAKELAQRLKVSLRTVQMALREMTDDGVCHSVREGRRTAYRIEDTTFCEITVI